MSHLVQSLRAADPQFRGSTCALLTAARAGVIAVVPGAGPPVDYTIPDASADLQAGAIAALRIEIRAE